MSGNNTQTGAKCPKALAWSGNFARRSRYKAEPHRAAASSWP